MKHHLQLTVYIVLSCTMVVVVSAARNSLMLNKTECNDKTVHKTELDIAKLISVGPHGRPFPENQQQLKGYCSESSQLLTRIDAFIKKCYKKDVQDLANIFMFTIKSTIKQFCKRKSKKLSKLLSATPCFNQYRENDSCMRLFIDTSKHLTKFKDDKVKIPHVCCNYVQAMKCQEELFDKIPCTGNNRELLMDFVRSIFGNLADFMCGEYNESTNRCDVLGPQPKSKSKNNKNYLTFMFASIDILQSMESFKTL